MVMQDLKSTTEKMDLLREPFQWPCRSSSTVQSASPSSPGSLFTRGWTRPPPKGISRINKIKEKMIYFYHLSVNYTNRSPAVGNDSQNGIH